MTGRRLRVCIIGAGIIGAPVAYHLARRGIDVRVFEQEAIPAGGTTGTAFGRINRLHGDLGDAKSIMPLLGDVLVH